MTMYRSIGPFKYGWNSKSVKTLLRILAENRPTDDCWEWPAARDRDGYGRINFDGAESRTHRASWMLANGRIPDGLWVLHKCDNPPCVNPGHLFLGTVKENMADCVRKGRSASGDRSPSRSQPWLRMRGDYNASRTMPEKRRRGSANHAAKLNALQVVEIRRRRAAGEKIIELSARFSVSNQLISAICLRQVWEHLP